jgi:hypothetical protein
MAATLQQICANASPSPFGMPTPSISALTRKTSLCDIVDNQNVLRQNGVHKKYEIISKLCRRLALEYAALQQRLAAV